MTLTLALALPAMASAQEDSTSTVTPPARSSTAQPTEADLRAALAKLKDEPTVAEIQQAALEHYKVTNAKADSMRRRAGWKNIIPKVTAEARLNSLGIIVTKFDYIQFPNREAGEDRLDGSVTEFKAVATWDLPKLIFNPEVLDTYSLKRYRTEIVMEVTKLYFARRRLQLDFLMTPPSNPSDWIGVQLRIDELTAMLDAMTGGVYADQAG